MNANDKNSIIRDTKNSIATLLSMAGQNEGHVVMFGSEFSYTMKEEDIARAKNSITNLSKKWSESDFDKISDRMKIADREAS